MKFSYYGYCIKNVKTGVRYLHDITLLMRTFCEHQDPTLKNKFKHNGDNLYLLPHDGNIYNFIQTKDSEVIKKVNRSDISVSEIYDTLEDSETLGLASYILIRNGYIGFGSTMGAPRFQTFANFVNDILEALDLSPYKFELNPFLNKYTREDALMMPFIGKSRIQVTHQNTLFHKLTDLFGGNASEFTDVDCFEVTIKPKRRRDIGQATRRVMSHVSDAGLDQMALKAKSEATESLTEIYLTEKGHLFDIINSKPQTEIASTIRRKVRENGLLQQKISAHMEANTYERQNIPTITAFNRLGAWAERFSHIPSINKE